MSESQTGLRALRGLTAAALAAAVTIVLMPASALSEPGTYAERGYPTIFDLQAESRSIPRAAYPASGGSRDPCWDVRAFPGRYDQATKDSCGNL